MTVIAHNIAKKLRQKDNRDFWKKIKHIMNKKSQASSLY